MTSATIRDFWTPLPFGPHPRNLSVLFSAFEPTPPQCRRPLCMAPFHRGGAIARVREGHRRRRFRPTSSSSSSRGRTAASARPCGLRSTMRHRARPPRHLPRVRQRQPVAFFGAQMRKGREERDMESTT